MASGGESDESPHPKNPSCRWPKGKNKPLQVAGAGTARLVPILLVEDTTTAEAHFRRIFHESEYDVHTATTPLEATQALEEMGADGIFPKCIVVDLTLREDYSEGIALIRDIRRRYFDVPIVVWSKHSPDICSLAFAVGATKAVEKYTDDRSLLDAVTSLIRGSA